MNKQTNRQNPYKGLYFYEEEDKDVFYGRETETKNLFKLVRHNLLTVVFGKSGIGKTSLINAGLFPRIRENEYLPIRVRLDYSPSAPGLPGQVRETIKKEIKRHNIREIERVGDKQAKAFGPGETLWEYFRRVRHVDASGSEVITPVLVFDQFEEIFTLGKNHRGVDALIDELYYLIENQFPDSLKERILKEEGEFFYGAAKPIVRVIISLREDYLPHLNSLKSRVPSIDRVLFRVIHLNGKQAREIIGVPGGIQDENVVKGILRLFYPGEAEEKEDIPDEKLEIEPSILSLLCFQLFERERGKKKEEGVELITKKDQDKILADFYDSVMEKFPAKVENFIESKLLTEGGFRTPFYLERNYPLRDSIETLVHRRILRKVHYGEKDHIEIIHDVLAPIIREKRNKRLEEERKREFQKELRQKRIINRVIIIAGIVSILLAFYAFDQKNRANKQYKIARAISLAYEANLILSTDNVKSIRIAEAAYKISFPHSPPRVMQALSYAAASTLGRPFYTANMQHTSDVNSAVFSPDGTRILTASDDKTAKLWDLQGNLLADLNKHTGDVNSAVFSPDGTWILTASFDKTAKLWDLQSNLLADLNKHTDEVNSAVFSPDGTRILTASYDTTAKLWDLQGNLLADLNKHTSDVYSAVFSPDGTRILTASADKTAKLWDLNGNLLADLNKHTDDVESAVFSPDGTRILTASYDTTAKLWDLNGKILVDLNKHTNYVKSAVFSPDGTRILTASEDKTAKLWDLHGKLLNDFNKHTYLVNSAVFSPDGTRILTAYSDHTAKLWDLHVHGNFLSDFNMHTNDVNSAVFSPNGTRILTASDDDTAKLWDLKGKPLVELKKEKYRFNIDAAIFSPDGTRILTRSPSRDYRGRMWYFRMWNLQGDLIADFNQHKGGVYSAVFSPDGTRILTASSDNTAKLWDCQGKYIADYEHSDDVRRGVFSPDGTRILTASYDNTAKLWDLKGNLLANFDKHTDSVFRAEFSPDGTRILTSSEDNTAKLWDLRGNLLEDFDKHTDSIFHAEFSPDGTRILIRSPSRDYRGRMWYFRMWDLQGEPIADFKHTGRFNSAVFSPDGTRILTTSGDGTFKLWDLQGNLIADFNKHTDDVRSAVFSLDGTRILTTSGDGTFKLWDLRGNLLANFDNHTDTVWSAVFSPDSTRILTTSRYYIKLWDLQGNLLADLSVGTSTFAVFSPDGTRILTPYWGGRVILWYTPEAIIEWLKTANIPHLSPEEKIRLGLE